MKPIVHYRNDGKHQTRNIGNRAFISLVDHPITDYVLTSRIVRLGPLGEFETENTIYRATPVVA